MAKITLSNLAHSYLHKPQSPEDFALRSLNHVWDDGAAYALLGPSGCGKSTLLNIISGLVKPSQGKILFNEVDVTNADTSERNIAQVFQFPVVYDTMTVRENLAFPLRNRKLQNNYIEKRVNDIASLIGIADLLNTKARGLTADTQQKISLARGIVREDVNAILFDEPLTVIDPHMKWELRTQLKSIHQQLANTMIYVTHDQTEALTFADKVVVMSQGEVVQIGTPKELFERPAHTFVGYFIGSPGMNMLPANVISNTAVVGEYKMTLNKTYSNLKGDIVLGIRPEHIKISDDSSGLPVEITRIEDVGRYKIVRSKHKKIAINVIIKDEIAFSSNNQYLTFDPVFAHIYCDDWLVKGSG